MLRIICPMAMAAIFCGVAPQISLAQSERQDTQSEIQAEIERLRQRIDQLEQNSTQSAPDATLDQNASLDFSQGNLLNPEITVFIDMGASLSSNGDDGKYNRFNLRETEVDFRAAIAPFADGVLVLAIGEEIEDDGMGGSDIEFHFELEEGYIDFHTLPNDLAVKAGKFRNAFGRNNTLHTHDLPQVSRPLPVEAFLGGEGLSTIGASASWLVPNPWDAYINLTGEVLNADGGEESPILGGPNAENPAVIGHLSFFHELGENADIEIGTSYMHGKTDADADFDADVFGVDLTYFWRDPRAPDSRSFLLQSELFIGSNDVNPMAGTPFRNDSTGFYAFGQYQLNQDWYTGVRFDYTEFPLSESRGPGDQDWQIAPYVSFYLTEFL
ncbi:MAG: hypothetical protein ACYTF7_10375, partial [Planctomycetota bacterium]